MRIHFIPVRFHLIWQKLASRRKEHRHIFYNRCPVVKQHIAPNWNLGKTTVWDWWQTEQIQILIILEPRCNIYLFETMPDFTEGASEPARAVSPSQLSPGQTFDPVSTKSIKLTLSMRPCSISQVDWKYIWQERGHSNEGLMQFWTLVEFWCIQV